MDDRTIIAENGGVDLYVHCLKNNRVKIEAYRQSVEDLAHMYGRRIFIRDIKSENLTIDFSKNSSSGTVHFIDTDETALPQLNNYADTRDIEYKYTERLVTPEILSGRRKGDFDILKIGDEYAMLLTMIGRHLMTRHCEICLILTVYMKQP